jgi:hypothetical protein
MSKTDIISTSRVSCVTCCKWSTTHPQLYDMKIVKITVDVSVMPRGTTKTSQCWPASA